MLRQEVMVWWLLVILLSSGINQRSFIQSEARMIFTRYVYFIDVFSLASMRLLS